MWPVSETVARQPSPAGSTAARVTDSRKAPKRAVAARASTSVVPLGVVARYLGGTQHDAVAAIEEPEERIADREEVERLIRGLSAHEADVVRLYHLEGKSYREISSQVGIAENSIGPTLSRARSKMR